MKKILSLCLLITSFSAFADLAKCLSDAELYLSQTHALTPDSGCINIIKSAPEKMQAISLDGSVKAYGINHMIYVETYSEGVLQNTELLAGDQTLLKNINFVGIDKANNRLLVLQEGESGREYLSYMLDGIGNVSPKNMLKDDKAHGATSVKWLNENEVALTFSSEEKVKVFSTKADSRYSSHAPEFVPSVLRTESIP